MLSGFASDGCSCSYSLSISWVKLPTDLSLRLLECFRSARSSYLNLRIDTNHWTFVYRYVILQLHIRITLVSWHILKSFAKAGVREWVRCRFCGPKDVDLDCHAPVSWDAWVSSLHCHLSTQHTLKLPTVMLALILFRAFISYAGEWSISLTWNLRSI